MKISKHEGDTYIEQPNGQRWRVRVRTFKDRAVDKIVWAIIIGVTGAYVLATIAIPVIIAAVVIHFVTKYW